MDDDFLNAVELPQPGLPVSYSLISKWGRAGNRGIPTPIWGFPLSSVIKWVVACVGDTGQPLILRLSPYPGSFLQWPQVLRVPGGTI